MVVWTIHCQFLPLYFHLWLEEKYFKSPQLSISIQHTHPLSFCNKIRDKVSESSKFHKTVLAIHDTVLIHRRGTTPKVTVPGSDVSAWQLAWNTGWLSLGTPLPAVAGYSSPPLFFFFLFLLIEPSISFFVSLIQAIWVRLWSQMRIS